MQFNHAAYTLERHIRRLLYSRIYLLTCSVITIQCLGYRSEHPGYPKGKVRCGLCQITLTPCFCFETCLSTIRADPDIRYVCCDSSNLYFLLLRLRLKTLDIVPFQDGISPSIARVVKELHSFIWHPRVYPRIKWTTPAFAFPTEAGPHLPIKNQSEDERLSWPRYHRLNKPSAGNRYVTDITVVTRFKPSRLTGHLERNWATL